MGYVGKKVDGKKFDEHRLIFEKHIRRKLKPTEIIHHIDGDKGNNAINNLMLFPSKSAHARYHFQNGDYKLIAGHNKKKLIDGKLECAQCGTMKPLKDFQKRPLAYLGVVGVCRVCRVEEVRRYKARKKTKLKK